MIRKFGPKLRQYMVLIVANFTLFQFGLTVGWMSPAVVRLREENQTILPQPLTETETSWLVSLGAIFAIVAFLYVGLIADFFGRKWSILIAVLPRIICSFLKLFASRVWMLYLAKAFGGLSDFSVITVMSMYTSEIASKEIRGGLGSVSQISSALGAMILLAVGPFISYLSINLIHTSIIVLTSIPLVFLPESPYFLFSVGKTDEAIKVLTFLRGDVTKAHEELKDYHRSSRKSEKMSIRKLIRDPVLLKTMGIVIFLAVGGQMIGYAVVVNYLQIIFESTGTNVSAEISSVIVGFLQVFACICTILLTDRFGRKPVLTITLFLLAVGLIGLGTFFKILDDGGDIVGFLNYLPLISMAVVVLCYNAGMGALTWIQIAELLDGPSRAFGITGAALSGGTFTFLTLRYFTPVAEALGNAAAYWIFATSSLITCLFIAFVIPETKGKAFSQIQRELGRK